MNKLQDYLAAEHDTCLLLANTDQLEAFTGLWLHKQGVAPKSRHVVVAAVKNFYNWARDKGLLSADPAKRLPYPKIGRKLPRQLGLSNAERLLMQPDIGTFSGLRDAAMLALLMGCGMRVAGLTALNQEDLFWFEYQGRQRLALRVTEKGGHERELPVPHEAMLLLQAYLGHDELLEVDRSLPSGGQVLFISLRNRKVPEHEYVGEARRLTEKSVWSMVQKYGEAAGLPDDVCHPHAMRHMLGAEMMEEDISTLQIQAILGHADPKTSEIYARIARGKLTEVVDKANSLRKIKTAVTPLVQEVKKGGVL
ncbi:recombinase XerD [Sansalvadorimonas verongulae]|nr:recombinase XerD [Sansalvadorimonas verongulae]